MLSARKMCLMSGLDVRKPSMITTLNVMREETKRKEEQHNDKKPRTYHREER